MKEMKTHENAVSLLSTVISAIITFAAGTGLSILLNGFVRGFLALTAIALILALIVAWRRPFSLELHHRGLVPEVELVRRPRAGRS
jgi:hypothetical protein